MIPEIETVLKRHGIEAAWNADVCGYVSTDPQVVEKYHECADGGERRQRALQASYRGPSRLIVNCDHEWVIFCLD